LSGGRRDTVHHAWFSLNKAFTLDQPLSIHLYGHGKSLGIYVISSETYQVDPLLRIREEEKKKEDL
jgi:hypothetical protein